MMALRVGTQPWTSAFSNNVFLVVDSELIAVVLRVLHFTSLGITLYQYLYFPSIVPIVSRVLCALANVTYGTVPRLKFPRKALRPVFLCLVALSGKFSWNGSNFDVGLFDFAIDWRWFSREEHATMFSSSYSLPHVTSRDKKAGL